MENLDEKNKEEISFMLAKKVIELRMKKRTRQQFKSDEFSKTKKELARLLTVKEILSNSKVNNIFSEKNSTSMGS
jgi:ribosomal protein L29